jgi:hypothetical protein
MDHTNGWARSKERTSIRWPKAKRGRREISYKLNALMIQESEADGLNKMPDEWRQCILVPIFKNKGMCKVVIGGSNC